jgi:RNA polymerase sigma-70 factor, ECF subfamily
MRIYPCMRGIARLEVPTGVWSRRPADREGEAARRLAFDEFTQQRLQRAYHWAGLLLGDRMEAEDAVHDAAVAAWMHWGELRDPARLDAWFDRILLNVCRARMRRRRITLVELDDPPATDAGQPDDQALRVADRDQIRRALAELGPDHRMTVVLRYGAGLSTGEIATRMAVSEGTVKSRLHYALRRLRATIEAAERLPGGMR